MRYESTPTGVRLHLKVVPNASRDQISGWLGDRLKIRVAAPPEAGKANEAVIRLLSRALGVDRRRISIVAGPASPEKTIEVRGVSIDALAAALPD